MEFEFNINNLISSEISKFDSRLTPARSCPGSNEFKDQLSRVVDAMGEASAKAQSLHGAITSGRKMAYSDHTLYLMKDSEACGGKGAVVGFLKLGNKKLFVYDSHGGHHEMDPVCVLDFYVHESRQRTGCGHKLFEHMLRDQNIKPAHLAIDRPSHKFSQFLIKYYHLKATIPQVNNFVIFSGFFQDRNSGGNSSRKNAGGRPPMPPYRKHQSPSNSQPHQNGYSSRVHEVQVESNMEKNLSTKLIRTSDNISEGQSVKHQTDLYNITPAWYRNPPSVFLKASMRKNFDNSVPQRSDSTSTENTNNALLRLGEGATQRPADSDQAVYGRHMINPTPPLPDIGQTLDSRQNSIRKVPSPPPRRNGNPEDFKHLLNTHQDVYDRYGHLKTSPLQPETRNRHKTAPLRNEPRTLMKDSTLNSNATRETSAGENGHGASASNFNGIHQTAAIDLLGNQTKSDVLLPKSFTPYKELSLPPGDPYSYRATAKKLNNTGWNIFGVPQEPRSYSAADRWKTTRPW